MNIFCFTGALGNDAEVRYTQSGTAIASFNVAANAGYGDNKTTVWLRCALFGKRAEGGLIPYLVKGQKVAVTGELSVNEWVTNDGDKRKDLQIRVNDIDLIGDKKGGQQAQQQQPAQQAPAAQAAPASPDFSDDIPFANPYKNSEYLV